MRPPDPEMRSPATLTSDRAKSQSSLSSIDNAIAPIDLQSRKLCRLFILRHDTACTIATLAYGVAR